MSVPEEVMRSTVAQQQAVANMTVWKRRLPLDDGFQFEAAVKRPGPEWQPANRADLVMIACRALSGNT